MHVSEGGMRWRVSLFKLSRSNVVSTSCSTCDILVTRLLYRVVDQFSFACKLPVANTSMIQALVRTNYKQ